MPAGGELRHVADLLTRAPAQPGRPAHVAAASGLVRRSGRLIVAADDELALAVFGPDGGAGEWVALDGDPLPLEPGERKAAKPDVEALALMPGGSVLALGSGATAARERAWLWPPGDRPEPLELGRLYARLREAVPDLNVEGAAWHEGALWLAQRGNGPAGRNALLRIDLERAAVEEVVEVVLGELDGIPLTLSDLDPRPDGRLAFAAVAEATASTYEDGPIGGAALGVVDSATGAVAELEPLAAALKVEGLCGDLIVADADDHSRPAPLLQVLR